MSVKKLIPQISSVKPRFDKSRDNGPSISRQHAKSKSKSLLSSNKTKLRAEPGDDLGASASNGHPKSVKEGHADMSKNSGVTLSDDEESAEVNEVEEDEEEAEMFGFASDDADSSDEEDINNEGMVLEGIDVQKLPTIAKDDATIRRKLEKAKRRPVRLGLFFFFHSTQSHLSIHADRRLGSHIYR